MHDTNDVGSDVQIQLEKEMDKIIMLADSFNERALTTRQTSSATKRQSGLKNPRRNFLLVHKKKQKKAQASCVAEVPLLVHKRPRLSPLAARAALAAAVIPLRQASQVILFEKSPELSARSARCKVCTSCMVVAEDDPGNLHVEKDQNTIVAVATTKRGCRPTSYCSLVKEKGGTHVHRCICEVMEKNDVELIIDIPIYEDFLLENAIDLTIDIPIFVNS